MRLVICGLSLSSSWGNGHATTWRSLVKGLSALGHSVEFYERDVPWYAEHRDGTSFEGAQLHLYESIDSLMEDHRPAFAEADAVIVGSYVPEGAELIDRLEGVVEGQLCFYDIDTPVTLEALAEDGCAYLRRDQIPCFDHHFSFSGGRALDALAKLGARRPSALHCSVDTTLYRPATDRPLRWRLGYMGTWSEDRRPVVERLLLAVAERWPEERFVVAGPGYPDVDRWPPNVDWLPHVGPANHRRFYAEQAFTLNATRAAMIALGSSPSVRLFEAAACGSCIVSDVWPGLDEVFEPGREVLVAHDTQAMLELLRDLPESSRRAIGQAARARAVADHSHLRRAQELVERLEGTGEAWRAAT